MSVDFLDILNVEIVTGGMLTRTYPNSEQGQLIRNLKVRETDVVLGNGQPPFYNDDIMMIYENYIYIWWEAIQRNQAQELIDLLAKSAEYTGGFIPWYAI